MLEEMIVRVDGSWYKASDNNREDNLCEICTFFDNCSLKDFICPDNLGRFKEIEPVTTKEKVVYRKGDVLAVNGDDCNLRKFSHYDAAGQVHCFVDNSPSSTFIWKEHKLYARGPENE